MELKKLLERVTAGFSRTRSGSPTAAESFDIAVADIALMIAALDGVVLPEELTAYQWIAERCGALSDAERRRHLDAAVRKAGHLLLMAQIGIYSEDELLAAFDGAVREALPNGFAGCSRTDVRRALVLWVAASVADGDFSDLEHRAVESLRTKASADALPEADFLATAERHLRDLQTPERRSDAETALDRLVVFS